MLWYKPYFFETLWMEGFVHLMLSQPWPFFSKPCWTLLEKPYAAHFKTNPFESILWWNSGWWKKIVIMQKQYWSIIFGNETHIEILHFELSMNPEKILTNLHFEFINVDSCQKYFKPAHDNNWITLITTWLVLITTFLALITTLFFIGIYMITSW